MEINGAWMFRKGSGDLCVHLHYSDSELNRASLLLSRLQDQILGATHLVVSASKFLGCGISLWKASGQQMAAIQQYLHDVQQPVEVIRSLFHSAISAKSAVSALAKQHTQKRKGLIFV